MKHVIIIGNGISGLSCAIRCAKKGVSATLVSPFPSERAQSVMAAGGINAVLSGADAKDSVDCHIRDTLDGGCGLGGEQAVAGLCGHAEEVIRELERLGTVFSLDESGHLSRRAFGGQSHKRTYYCGASTGKQIVSALVMEARRYEAKGLIRRMTGYRFYSALIREKRCYGTLLFHEKSGELLPEYADAVVIASGGQNALFGKTTGSTQCDGYVTGKLFLQGVELKNLEFIQYHPTTLETAHKRMLISEAARGEGGRLFYEKEGDRIYFMEDKYGAGGNLMCRDVVAREMYATREQVYLDVSFLGKTVIENRLSEVRDLCLKYAGIDISRQPIPVAPSVHFFMGGIAVHLNHETCIRNLFAVGECASIYHGANRLGGNSLLAAVYGACVAADEIAVRAKTDDTRVEADDTLLRFGGNSTNAAADEVMSRPAASGRPDFEHEIMEERQKLQRLRQTESRFSVTYLRDMLAETMREDLGIVRSLEGLLGGIRDVDYYLSVADRLNYDSSVPLWLNYSLKPILSLAKATLLCAKSRQESRGAHYRSDYPDSDKACQAATLISCNDGNWQVRLDRERVYES